MRPAPPATAPRAARPLAPRPPPPARRPAPRAPPRVSATASSVPPPPRRAEVRPEAEVPGLAPFLDGLKFGKSDGLLVAIVQHIDTGELLMQAFADRAAVGETLQTGLATFYSRSRGERWCKGETSGAYLAVASVHADCDGDALVYLATPAGPACHTGAPSCWFSAALPDGAGGVARLAGRDAAPLPTLSSLERTVAARAAAPPPDDGAKPSWTARLLADEPLLASKVREEADELARALTEREGRDRVASEAGDLIYHALVLLRAGGVTLEEVGAVLRGREGVSGVVEKAGRAAEK